MCICWPGQGAGWALAPLPPRRHRPGDTWSITGQWSNICCQAPSCQLSGDSKYHLFHLSQKSYFHNFRLLPFCMQLSSFRSRSSSFLDLHPPANLAPCAVLASSGHRQACPGWGTPGKYNCLRESMIGYFRDIPNAVQITSSVTNIVGWTHM